MRDIPYDFVVFNGDCIDDPANEKEALYHLAYLCGKVGASHVPAFFLRGNHEIRNAYSIGLRALFDYVGDKTYGAFSWEIPVSSCWIAARINRIAHGCIMA